MKKSIQLSISISTGLALFAMFFGAGNMIFPLQIGTHAGQHIVIASIAFIITGVGCPFLGLYAVSLYEGDYWKVFQTLGKPLSFLVVTFLILILCFFVATPRTEIVTYDTLAEHIPIIAHHRYLFGFIYFLLVFLIISKPARIVDIIGWILSPIKVITFVILIVFSIYFGSSIIHVQQHASHIFTEGLEMGYDTMDLLAGLFFCTIAYRNIAYKCRCHNVSDSKEIQRQTLVACLIGASLIAVIYIGFIVASAFNAQSLANVPTGQLLGKIATMVLGDYGFAFVAICVSFACLATAAALTAVAVDYVHQLPLFNKTPKKIILVFTLLIIYIISNLGFNTIMNIAGPILSVVYPVTMVLCIISIFRKKMSK